MTAPAVNVVGLRAFNRDMGKMAGPNGPLLKAMQAAARAAVEPVAAATRSSLPQASGRLAGDVRVTATRTGAAVRMGRSSLRYAGWVEFGGHRRAPHESSRDYDSRGRYLFPNAIQLAASSARLYSDAITKAFNDFHWSNTDDTPSD